MEKRDLSINVNVGRGYESFGMEVDVERLKRSTSTYRIAENLIGCISEMIQSAFLNDTIRREEEEAKKKESESDDE